MKHTITLSMAASALLLLTACGGGGGSTTVSNTGYAGDGYIEGAYVCHDSDGDWDCLDETAYATTAADGSFTLSNYDPTIDLIVQVPAGAVDNGPFSDGSTTPRPFSSPVWYVYPAGAAPQNGPIFVGPMSTLVAAQIASVPGTTVADAVGMLGTQIGVDPDDILGNYLENDITTTSGTSVHFVAEIVGSALSSSSTATGTDYGVVLADVGNIVGTATSNDPATYDTTGYTTQTTPSTVSLNYQGVTDIHADLTTCYYGFESWDIGGDNRHKTLCLTADPDTGGELLNLTEYQLGTGNSWTLDHTQSSAYAPWQSKPVQTMIDMNKVNHATEKYTYPYRIFPAKLISSSGASALFESGVMQYKLVVSEADINALSGATLPQGPSIGSLIDPVTFAAGDKLYKAVAITQNKTYSVNNGYDHFFDTTTVDTIPGKYIVYDEGTVGGAAFTPMPNNQDITTLAGLTDTDFIVEYQDSNNFTKISITHPYNPSALLNTCQIEHIVNGSNGGTAQMGTFTIETHNGTPFFVLQNYRNGADLFIGKISAIDGSSFVYGWTQPAYLSHNLTEGGYQSGDIMDDIMLNQSARDRVLNSVNAPLTLP